MSNGGEGEEVVKEPILKRLKILRPNFQYGYCRPPNQILNSIIQNAKEIRPAIRREQQLRMKANAELRERIEEDERDFLVQLELFEVQERIRKAVEAEKIAEGKKSTETNTNNQSVIGLEKEQQPVAEHEIQPSCSEINFQYGYCKSLSKVVAKISRTCKDIRPATRRDQDRKTINRGIISWRRKRAKKVRENIQKLGDDEDMKFLYYYDLGEMIAWIDLQKRRKSEFFRRMAPYYSKRKKIPLLPYLPGHWEGMTSVEQELEEIWRLNSLSKILSPRQKSWIEQLSKYPYKRPLEIMSEDERQKALEEMDRKNQRAREREELGSQLISKLEIERDNLEIRRDWREELRNPPPPPEPIVQPAPLPQQNRGGQGQWRGWQGRYGRGIRGRGQVPVNQPGVSLQGGGVSGTATDTIQPDSTRARPLNRPQITIPPLDPLPARGHERGQQQTRRNFKLPPKSRPIRVGRDARGRPIRLPARTPPPPTIQSAIAFPVIGWRRGQPPPGQQSTSRRSLRHSPPVAPSTSSPSPSPSPPGGQPTAPKFDKRNSRWAPREEIPLDIVINAPPDMLPQINPNVKFVLKESTCELTELDDCELPDRIRSLNAPKLPVVENREQADRILMYFDRERKIKVTLRDLKGLQQSGMGMNEERALKITKHGVDEWFSKHNLTSNVLDAFLSRSLEKKKEKIALQCDLVRTILSGCPKDDENIVETNWTGVKHVLCPYFYHYWRGLLIDVENQMIICINPRFTYWYPERNEIQRLITYICEKYDEANSQKLEGLNEYEDSLSKKEWTVYRTNAPEDVMGHDTGLYVLYTMDNLIHNDAGELCVGLYTGMFRAYVLRTIMKKCDPFSSDNFNGDDDKRPCRQCKRIHVHSQSVDGTDPPERHVLFCRFCNQMYHHECIPLRNRDWNVVKNCRIAC